MYVQEDNNLLLIFPYLDLLKSSAIVRPESHYVITNVSLHCKSFQQTEQIEQINANYKL